MQTIRQRAKSVFDNRRRNLLDLRASSVKLSAEKLSGNSEKLLTIRIV